MGGGKKWTYSGIVKDKAIRLLLPGFIFGLIAFAVKIAFPGEVSRQASVNIKVFFVAFLYPYDNPFRELWFIVALFWYFMLTPLWKFVIKRKRTVWLLSLLLVLLHFVHPETTFLSIDKFCLHAIWFFLGILVCKERVVENMVNKNNWVTMAIGIILYLIRGYIPLSGTVGLIVFSFGGALMADRFLPKLFFGFRDYTYQIFLMGIFAQVFLKIVYRHVSWPYIPTFVLCIAAGLYVPVLVSKLIEKINWKPLALCVGLKTK